ncbi:MAG: beta-1,6-N-acetylglucosaminyltransferase [Streptosporangiaceae bacterium]
MAFLIMNHRDPAQLMRLVTTLRLELPEAPIVVHNDKFRTHIAPSALDPIGNAYLLTNDEPIWWGDFSLVDAFWRSMAWMIEQVEFDWLILLSAQDYPIKPFAKLGDYLAATGADVLLRAAPISQLSKEGFGKRFQRDKCRRYLYQYRLAATDWKSDELSSRLRRWFRRHADLFADVLNKVQPCLQISKLSDQVPWRVGFRARSTPFTRNEPCWFGSMWMSLSRRAAEFVVTSARERPDYVEYYRRTVVPDESATATLVCNAPELRIEPHNIHHVRWTHSRKGHPDVFVAADLPELLAAPEHEFFARKFDMARDAEILDELDRMLARARATSSGASSDGY